MVNGVLGEYDVEVEDVVVEVVIVTSGAVALLLTLRRRGT
jgi:hypothetical protein